MIRRFTVVLAAAVALASLASTAPAQTNIFWNGTGSTWNSLTGWWTTAAGTTTVPSFSGTTIVANFNATSVTGAQAITLDANQVVQGIVFAATATGGDTVTSGGAGTNTLTIGANGIVDNAGTGADSIGANLLLSAGQTWTNNSSNALTISGNTSLATSVVAATTLTAAGSGNTFVSGSISTGGGAGASLALTYSGTGTLTFSGSNTYTGTTTLANVSGLDTLQLDFSAAGAPANNIINNSVAIANNAISSGSALSVGGGTLRVRGSTAPSTTNSQAFNGTTVTAGQTVLAFTGTAGNTINLDLGGITRTAAGGQVNFTQPTAGTANIYTTTANPAFTGGSNTILGGWALFTPAGSSSPTTWATSAGSPAGAGLVTGLASYTVADGSTPITAAANIDVQASPATVGTLTVNSLRFNTGTPVTVIGTAANTLTVASGGILETAAVGNNAVTITGGNLATGNGADLIVNQYNTASPLTIAAAVTGTTGLTLGGGGTLVLSGANTYSGGTRLNAGTLQLGDGTTNNGTTTYAGVISGSGGVVVAGPGTFAFSAQNPYTGNFTINAGTASTGTGSGGGNSAFGAVNASRTITINAGATLNTTINNFLVGAGSSAAALPTITINGGTMSTTRYNAIGNLNLNSGATLVQSATDAGAYNGYQFLGTITVGGTSPSTISTTNGKADHLLPAGITFNVGTTGGAGPDLIVSAPLANDSGDYGNGTASALIKSGAGIMLLSGANTYTGNTTINAGVLQLGNAQALQFSPLNFTSANQLQFVPLPSPSAGYYAIGSLSNTNLPLTDTSGSAITLLLGGTNITSTYTGVLSGVGSRLAKTGSGVLTLTNSNTYTNGTILAGGTLVATNGLASLGSGPVTVNFGTTLADGLAIDPTFVNAVQNTPTAFTLAMGANSSNNLDFSASGANLPYASLGANGNVTYSGTMTPYGGASGTYRLGGGGGTLTYSSSLTGSGASLIKNGTGSTVALTSAATLTGTVTLAQGVLNLNSSATFLNLTSTGITLLGNPGETVTSAAPLAPGNINLSGPTLFLNDGSGTTDHFGATRVIMNGGSIELLSSGSTTIQDLEVATQGQIVSAPSGGTGAAIKITNLSVPSVPAATVTFQSQTGPIGSGTTNVGQIYITNLNTTPVAVSTTTMLGPGMTVQTPSNQGGDGHTYFAAYGANGVTQLTGTVATMAAAIAAPNGNLVDLGETVAGTSPFVVNSVVTINGDLLLPNTSLLNVTSGGVIFGGNSHWIKANSAQTASITGGTAGNGYQLIATVNNGGTDGGTDYEFNNVRITDNGGNPLSFVKGGSGLLKIGQSGTGGVGTANYTGGTTINGGTLQLNVGGALGTLTGSPQIFVNQGGTLMGGANDSFGFTANLDVITLNGGTITQSAGNIRQTLWNMVTMYGGLITAPAGTGNNGNYSIDAGITATSDVAGNPAVINAAQIGLQNGNGGGTANPFNVNRGPGAVDLFISSQIFSFSAGNGITFNGNGVTVLTANNTYTGVTNITGGTIILGNGANTGSLGTGAVTINGGLVYNRLDNFTVANSMSGFGTLTQAGTGAVTLTGALATFTGQTNINAGGTLRLGDGVTTTGSILQSSSIVNNGALVVSYPSPNNQTYGGTISGTGSLTKSGTGLLTLSSIQTYTGSTTVSAGSLILQTSNSGLANTAISVAAGAAFSVHPIGNSITLGNTSTATAGATLSLAAGTGSNSGASFDMADGGIGIVNLQQGSSFGGAGLTLGGAGTLVNAPTLAFEIGNSANIDTLAVTKGVTVGASGAKIAFSPVTGTTSLVTGDYTFMTAGGGLGDSGITLASTILNVGSHSYVLALDHSTTTSEVLTISNSTIQPPTIAYWKGSLSSSWGTFSGVNTINTNWRSDAAGTTDTQQLPGPESNVFFTINSGAANLTNTLGLDFSINSLNFTGSGTSATSSVTINGPNTLTINAAAVNGNAAGSGITVASGSGAHTITANVVLGASQTWTNSSTNQLTVTGNIGDGGNAYGLTTAGPITLSGTNTYSGGTTIASGTLTINSDVALGAIPVSPQTSLTFAGNGTLRAGTTLSTVANRGILIGTGVTATFDTNGNTMTIAGPIADSDGAGIVNKIGNGVLILSGTSSYGGGTTVAAGTLRAGAAGNATIFGLSGSSVTVASGATLDYNGIPLNGTGSPDYAVIASGTGVGSLGALVDNGAANDSSFRLLTLTGDTTVGGTGRFGLRSSVNGSGALTGNGFSLTKIGTNDFLIAQGAGGFPTLATGLANININAGRIVVADTATVDNLSPGSIFVNTNGALDVGNYNGFVTIDKPIVMAGGTIVTDAASANGNATIAAPISLNATGLFNPQATSVLTLAGNITDGTAPNGITVNGAGTVVLTAANSYSGVTTIGAGTLQIDNGGTTGTLGTANVVNNAALVFNRGDDIIVTNAISGSGSVTHAGPGDLTLTGNLTYTGPTTISTGVLTLANPTNNVTLSGTISGAGSLVKSQTNRVSLTNGNSYQGGTTINKGVLAISTNTALGTGNVTLNGGTLQLQAATGVLTGRSIGINFEGGQTNGTVGVTSLLATDSAGVVPQANWNNVSSTTTVVVSNTVPGGNANIDGTSPVPGSIVDNNGQVVAGATINFLSNNPWAVSGTVPTGGDAKLMNGYADLANGTTTTSVTLANLPYASYSVYAYVGSDGNGRVGHGTIGASTLFFTTNDNPFGGYVQATATSQATSVASNYLLFQNVAGSTFTYSQAGNTNNVGLHGVQIVETGNGPLTIANNLVVTADSIIDVTGFNSATVTGSLSIGANKLSVTGGSTGANAPYRLNLGTTSISGNATFDVANNGTGSGTLVLGTVDDGGNGFGIIKAGNGILALTGVNGNTYSGSTSVNAGTLLVANSSGSATGSASVTVANTGTLGVSAGFGAGSISGAVSVNGGGVTSASIGNQSAASLILANGLSLAVGSKSSFALNGTGVNNTVNSNALVYVSGGSLAVAGATTVDISGSPAIGTYALYGYSAGPTSISNFAASAAPAGYAWHLAVSSGGSGSGSTNPSADQLDLVVTKVPLTWTGATDGAWNTSTQNWAMGLPGVATTYSEGFVVNFADRDPVSGNLVTNTAVTIQAGGVSPGSVNFTNSGAAHGGVDYTVAGKMTLPASASISKSGTGSATLTGPILLGNSDSIAVTGGTLKFNVTGSGGSVGTGSVATVASGATLELAGSVSALSSTGSAANRVDIVNNSKQASGGSLRVSGTNQQVGAITGTGDTVVNANSNLTANSIVQNALAIGGDANHTLGSVTIAASDSSGNPLGASLAVAGSLHDATPVNASLGAAGVLSGGNSSTGLGSLGGGLASLNLGGSTSAVPEPSTFILLAAAALGGLMFRRRAGRKA